MVQSFQRWYIFANTLIASSKQNVIHRSYFLSLKAILIKRFEENSGPALSDLGFENAMP